MKGPEELRRPRERSDVPDQLAVVASPSGAGFRFVMAEQLGNKLVAAHADQTVDGVHRSPLARVA